MGLGNATRLLAFHQDNDSNAPYTLITRISSVLMHIIEMYCIINLLNYKLLMKVFPLSNFALSIVI